MTDDRLVNVSDVDWTDHDHGDHEFRRKRLGAAAGGEDVGCSLYEVPDGERTWLRHYHEGNEEAVFVLDGEGTLFLGPDADERALTPGDYVALPADERGTHEIAGGEGGLRYLMVSTMNEPDVTVYPDEGTVGVFAGSAPGGTKSERTLSKTFDIDAAVPYWGDE